MLLSLKAQIFLIPLILVFAGFFEWCFHKYILHGLGKNPKSFWSFHWKDHHRHARRLNMMDPDYETSLFVWNAQTKELSVFVLGGIISSPLIYWLPVVYMTFIYCSGRYYFTHRKSHTHEGWAKEKLPWHYDHHMGPNQDLNWGVTRPWADIVLGTRKPM